MYYYVDQWQRQMWFLFGQIVLFLKVLRPSVELRQNRRHLKCVAVCTSVEDDRLFRHLLSLTFSAGEGGNKEDDRPHSLQPLVLVAAKQTAPCCKQFMCIGSTVEVLHHSLTQVEGALLLYTHWLHQKQKLINKFPLPSILPFPFLWFLLRRYRPNHDLIR